MEFCWANHSLYSKTAVAKFEEFRQNDKFCDVSLCSQNIVVKAHRVVLAAVSPYFEAMFTSGLRESNEKFVHLPGIHPDVLPLLVDFIYRAVLFEMRSVVEHHDGDDDDDDDQRLRGRGRRKPTSRGKGGCKKTVLLRQLQFAALYNPML
ncbi:Actin-binding protein IPP [Eumeta japonica]|uniref:Actin-binding protein IPP n=1 Tax=Eumeta variegata TaxID=151549 RepID=A0A4C1YIR7_EUMVA|nr:Actin-binding protein IPP [Eumeta japonica]